MSARKLTDEQIELAISLREIRGWSQERIARKVGVSVGAISWHLLKAGAEKPGAVPPNGYGEYRGPMVLKRGNHVVRRFEPWEDEIIERMDKQGVGPTAIGRRLNRRWNSVKGRLMTLARRAARAEARGQHEDHPAITP